MSIGDKIKQVWNKGQEDIDTRADRGGQIYPQHHSL